MASFHVHGPFKVDFEKRKGGRTLIFDDFWKPGSEAHSLAAECGCYIFAIRAGGGLQPIYVGKATKTFEQETFNAANKHKYHYGFSEYGKGTPLMYFVVHPHQKGRVNCKQIAEIEDFLIQAAVAKNPNLQNVRGRQEPKWSIKGVIRSGVGKPSKAEKDFVQLCDIRRK